MESLPRVLFMNHSVRDGGPGRSLFYILKYVDKSKIDPYVLVPKEDIFTELVKKEGLGDKIIVEGRFPENLQTPRLSWTSFNRGNVYQGMVAKLLKIASLTLNVMDLFSFIVTSPFLIRRKRIDIIYCNGTQAKIVGALIGFLNRCPVIWHVRNIQQTKPLGITINLLASLSVVKRIICVSGPTAEQFRSAHEKITVIHNGIDPEEFDPEKTKGLLRSEFSIPEGAVIVGSTGRIVPRKGYEHLIRAALNVITMLAEEGSKVRFVVVGDTPHFFQDNHLQFLKGLVSELGLQEHFIFTGYRKDVRSDLKDFDIFVIPSNYPDPFPRVVIEAMSFALPVVGFKVGGIVEAVENGVTGFLNGPGNTERMGEAILKLIQNRSLRLSMGAAGRERVKRLF
ncbi:MAG TPA: glycosyltransferase family 4 protein, partial [Thermodesulfobacteriota bacterium]